MAGPDPRDRAEPLAGAPAGGVAGPVAPGGGQAPPPARRRRRRAVLLALLALVLLLACLAFGGVAWLGSTGGLQWLARQTPLTVGTVRIRARAVSGSLWGHAQIGSLSVTTPTTTIDATDLALDWTPAALLRRRLSIQSLRIARLDVVTTAAAPSSGRPQVPASLRLPLAVDVDRLVIGALRQGKPGALRDLGALQGSAHYADARYAVQADADTPWAALRLNGTVGAERPYPIQATLVALRVGGDAANGAALRAGGSLEQLTLDGALQAGAAKAQVNAQLTPFAPVPVASAAIRSTALDPALFDKALPHASLDVRVDIGPSTASRVQGHVDVVNTRPGTLDQRLLPLRSLRADIAGDADAASVTGLLVDLGPAGQIGGSLQWQQNALQAHLQAERLNARAIDARLAATKLSGPAELGADAARQSLDVNLSQPGWDVRLRASRDGDTVQVSELRLRAPGGEADATGKLGLSGQQPFDLQATVRNLDPARFGDYPQAQLNGSIKAEGQLASRSGRMQLQLAPSQWRGREFSGHAVLQADPRRVRDVDATLRLGDNSLQAHGAFGLPADTLSWTLDAPTLDAIDSSVHGAIRGHGTLAGGIDAPAGRIDLQARSLRWTGLRLDALQASGDFRIASGKAPPETLPALLDRLGGQLAVQLDTLQWSAGPDTAALRVAHADISAKAGGDARAPVALHAQLRDARYTAAKPASGSPAVQDLRQATLAIDGTAAHHTIDLSVQGNLTAAAGLNDGSGSAGAEASDRKDTAAPLHVPLNLRLQAEGGWQGEKAGWSGRILALDNHDDALPLHLQQPATLTVAARPLHLQLGAAVLDAGGGVVRIDQLELAPELLRTQGSLQHFATGKWLQIAGLRSSVARSSLVLSGSWNLDAGQQINGSVQLQRDSGDLTLTALREPLALDIGQLVFGLQIHDSQLDGRLVVQSRLGTLQASGGFGLQRRDGVWGVAGDTPLRIDAGADMPSLDWAAPLLGPDYRLTGRLRLALTGRGTVADPQFSGSVDGDDLAFAWAAQGLNLQKGVLKARFTGDELRLEQLQFQGGQGSLTGSGFARLRDQKLTADVTLKADRLQAISSPDRQLVLSGSAQATVADRTLSITTALRADRADIALPRTSGPTLSSDVVVLGRENAATETSAAWPTRVRFDGSFDFGNDFRIHGKGLDAKLAGTIRVRASDGSPPGATGTVEVVSGAYTAYGQNLEVTSGRVNFNGPLDNPGLNITATRPNLPTGITVGVSITGTARRPVVKLTSDPAMPDTEILSWLVLGQPLDQVGATDIGVLQTAAAALLGNSDSVPLQTQLARAVGLDSISVQSTTLDSGQQESLVTVSKRLSSKLRLTFSRGIDGVSSIFGVQYQLTRRLSVQTRAGTENAIDLFYTFEFR